VDAGTWSRFFAVLALVAVVGGVALLASLPMAGGLAARLRADLAPAAIPLAALVAATSMAGSLYYSEVADLVPCELCWYQRIAMYPLALLLTIAAIRRDRRIGAYAAPLAGLGLAVSLYHYQLEWFPEQGSACAVDAPCSARQVEVFGFVSIPFMAGCGFLAVLGLLLARTRVAPSLQPDEP
jgi:disulfide bond formation protein DsbB